MKNLDYNKVMCVIGILLIIIFCMVLIIDYDSYDMFNSDSFSVLVLIRIIEFWIPGVILIYLYNQNTNLKETEYLIQSDKLPKVFSGYKIAHISDLHNTNSKKVKRKILETLENDKPDIVVITGDLVDSRRTNILNAKEFIKSVVKIAPVYYVLGNHESRLYNIQKLINEVKSVGVIILRNINIKIERQDEFIELFGIDDPAFYIQLESKDEIRQKTGDVLKNIVKDSKNFKILLIHRPELLDIYSKYKFNLVFTGHAHGGQIRLPIIGGIIAPGQGIFPKYTKGIYKEGKSQMILSRGIGNSKFPFRINNRPEIVIVKLRSSKL